MGTFSTPTKTVQDVADYVKRAFGDEAGVQITDADILRWTNSAQDEIVMSNQILKGMSTTVLVPDTYTYDLAAMDFTNIRSVHVNGIKLDYLSFNDAETYILSSDPQRTQKGAPRFWYEWAGVLHLYPTPNSADTLTIYHLKHPTHLADVNAFLSLPDNYFNRVVEFVLSQAYELDENFAAAGSKTAQFESKLVNMTNDENLTPDDTYPMINIRPEDY